MGEHFVELKECGVHLGELGWDAAEVEPLLAGEWTPPSLDEIPNATDESGGTGDNGHPAHQDTIRVTDAQLKIFQEAVNRIRDKEEDQTISEGRCLELVCADFLAGG